MDFITKLMVKAVRERIDAERRQLREGDPEAGRLLLTGARFLKEQHQIDAAVPFVSEALDVYRGTLGRTERLVEPLIRVALMYFQLNERLKALDVVADAVKLCREVFTKEDPQYEQNLEVCAALMEQLGERETPEKLYQEVLAARIAKLGPRHPLVAAVLNSLSRLYFRHGEYDAALPMIENSVDIRRQHLSEQDREFISTLNNLAMAYETARRHPDAERTYREVMDLRAKTVGTSHPDFADSALGCARALFSMGQHSDAQPLFVAAADIRRSINGLLHPDSAAALAHLALNTALIGNLADSQTFWRVLVDLNNQITVDLCSERERLKYICEAKLDLDLFLSSRTASDSAWLEDACDLVLRRKGIVAESVASRLDVLLARMYPAEEETLIELRRVKDERVRGILNGPGKTDIALHERFLADCAAQIEKLEARLAKSIPEIALRRRFRSANHTDIAEVLPPDTAVVEIVRYINFDLSSRDLKKLEACTSHYLIFILPGGKPEGLRCIDLGPADVIDRLLVNARRVVDRLVPEGESLLPAPETVHGLSHLSDPLGEISSRVLQPILDYLPGVRRLLICPDGLFCLFPFEVLPLDGGRVIDHLSVSYLTGGRDALLFGRQPVDGCAPPLIAGAPEFGLGLHSADLLHPPASEGVTLQHGPVDAWFNDLKGTVEECGYVAALLGVKPITGKEALKSRIKSAKSPSILHLATHGFFLNEPAPAIDAVPNRSEEFPTDMARLRRLASQVDYPMIRSGLAMAGAETWAVGATAPDVTENGILTAEEICYLDLRRTMLVVLSACDTGVGEIRTGEGVFGLRRAFHIAGAHTLVMSLWKVHDIVTAELMQTFYENLIAGMDRADALRSAQLRVKKFYSHPYYWAAFICQGDPGPLPADPRKVAAD